MDDFNLDKDQEFDQLQKDFTECKNVSQYFLGMAFVKFSWAQDADYFLQQETICGFTKNKYIEY